MSFTRNPQFMDRMKAKASERLMVAAGRVHSKAVSLIEEPKSGTHYPGAPNPSSEPGEPPASQSGALVDSLQVSDAIDSGGTIEAHVFSWLSRSRILQEGTITKAPRPFMLPALTESRTEIAAAFGGGDGD